MEISFHGACREVTGSCHLVDTGKTRFLVDCGLFQGGDFASKKNSQPFDFDPASIDFVLVTHAHMDHIGRLPKLCKEGLKGKIYSTPPTRDFADVMLQDSARHVLREARRQKRDPIYLEEDVHNTIGKFKTIKYRTIKKLAPDVKVQFRDAGHILGSAFIEIWIKQPGKAQDIKLVFSGDIGNPPVPLLEDTEFIDSADYLVIESTYGGRTHEPVKERHDLMVKHFKANAKKPGVMMIPAFSLERTQELLFEVKCHLLLQEYLGAYYIFKCL